MNSSLTSLYPRSEAPERQNSEKGREWTDSFLMSGIQGNKLGTSRNEIGENYQIETHVYKAISLSILDGFQQMMAQI